MLNLIYNLKHKLIELYNNLIFKNRKNLIYKKEKLYKGKIRYFYLI